MAVGVVFRLPYLRAAMWVTTWELSLGIVALMWSAVAFWSGVLYRGRYAALHRTQAPKAFAAQCGFFALVGLAAIALGVWRIYGSRQ